MISACRPRSVSFKLFASSAAKPSPPGERYIEICVCFNIKLTLVGVMLMAEVQGLLTISKTKIKPIRIYGFTQLDREFLPYLWDGIHGLNQESCKR